MSEDRIALARRAGFYPLILLLERMQRERVPVGATGAPTEEGVHFRHDPALSFSAADVSAFQRQTLAAGAEDSSASANEVYEITTTFLGLTGVASPLPSFFCEELVQEEAESTRTREFLDLFHHRLLSLFYRGQVHLDLPNSRLSDGSDAWSRRLLALLGFDEASTAGSGVPPWRWLRLAGLLGDGEVTAATLEVALTDVLGSALGQGSVFVEQFVGSWVEVEAAHLTRLGQNASFLGRDLLIGRRIFDRAGKYRIVVGPLSREGYAQFAEGSEPLRAMAQTVASLQGNALEYEVVLWLTSEAAPALQLSSKGQTRLGGNSWLGGQRREERVRVPIPAI